MRPSFDERSSSPGWQVPTQRLIQITEAHTPSHARRFPSLVFSKANRYSRKNNLTTTTNTMANFERPLPSVSSTQLSKWVTRLRDRIEAEVDQSTRVTRSAGTKDEESFSQSVRVTTPNGAALEVLIEWEKDTGKLEVELAPVSNAPGFVKYLSFVVAILGALWADQNPDLLPFFRGIRVLLGAVVGFTLGFVFQAIASQLFSKKSAPLDPAIEARVEGVVRELVDDQLALT